MKQIHTKTTLESQMTEYLRLICLPDVGNSDGNIVIGNRNLECDESDIITEASYLYQLLYCHPACIHFVRCKRPKA